MMVVERKEGLRKLQVPGAPLEQQLATRQIGDSAIYDYQ